MTEVLRKSIVSGSTLPAAVADVHMVGDVSAKESYLRRISNHIDRAPQWSTFDFRGGSATEPICESAVKMAASLGQTSRTSALVDLADRDETRELLIQARAEEVFFVPVVDEGRGSIAG